MKAREFKEFVKYSKRKMNIKLVDLDNDLFIDEGAHYLTITDEEIEKLWDKPVINFTIKEDECKFVYATYPPMHPDPTYTLNLYISNLTEEQREERKHNKEVQDAIEKLESLSGKKVNLN